MALRQPLSLESVFHYHQSAQTQPAGMPVRAGQERVELMTGGRGWIRDGGGWREVGAGDLIWNASGDCTVGRSDPADPYRCLAVVFRVRPPRGLGIPRFSHWSEPDQVAVLVEEGERLFADETFDRALLCQYMFTRLRLQVELDLRRQRDQRLPDPVRRVLDHIEREYAQPLGIPGLAALAGWSAAHLHEVFRATVGMTPHQWIIQRRLREVRRRLLSTPDPVKRIAVECGFADSAALAHAFRAAFGTSPKAFRERNLRVGGRGRV